MSDKEIVENKDWFIFKGDNQKRPDVKIPPAPLWRQGKNSSHSEYIPDTSEYSRELEIVNAGIYLKRPILITGNPGVGKSSLAHAIANELDLEFVKWDITTKTTLRDGLYSYDAIARLQDVTLKKDDKSMDTHISNYLFLGPLGYAFSSEDRPKVLLIDEIDKSDIDLPNDLLHILEEMEFVIPELERVDRDGKGKYIYPIHRKKEQEDSKPIKIINGKVEIKDAVNFPIILMTSNDEREFPPAFLRRCLRLDMKMPDKDRLLEIVKVHFENGIPKEREEDVDDIVDNFLTLIKDDNVKLSTDQLLNAIHLLFQKNIDITKDELLKSMIFKSLV